MLRIGMAGIGRWGRNLLRNLVTLEGVEVVGICDPDGANLAAARETAPGARPVECFTELLRLRPDGVVIAASVEEHFPLAREALAAGCHTFVEKPLALSVAQGAELTALAEQNGRALLVGHVLRYHPALEIMRREITAGRIGRVLTAYARRTNFGQVRHAENVIWSVAPHDLVNLAVVFGEWPTETACLSGAELRPGIADYAQLGLTYPSGRRAFIHVSWLDPQKKRELTVIGERGMLVWDDAARRLELHPLWAEVRDTASLRRTEHHAAEVEELTIPPAEPLRLELEHFAACCRGEARPLSDGAEALRVLRVLEAADASAAHGGAPIAVQG